MFRFGRIRPLIDRLIVRDDCVTRVVARKPRRVRATLIEWRPD